MRARVRTLVLGLTVVLTALGCSDAISSTSANVVLRTDRSEYVAIPESGEGSYRQYGFTILASLENHGEATVYLARCYPASPRPVYWVELVSQARSGGSAYNGTWACVGHDRQIRVRPGELRTDTLHLQGPNSFDHRTGEAFGILAGGMRIHYEVQTCPGDGACKLGASIGVSNVFTVNLAP